MLQVYNCSDHSQTFLGQPKPKPNQRQNEKNIQAASLQQKKPNTLLCSSSKQPNTSIPTQTPEPGGAAAPGRPQAQGEHTKRFTNRYGTDRFWGQKRGFGLIPPDLLRNSDQRAPLNYFHLQDQKVTRSSSLRLHKPPCSSVSQPHVGPTAIPAGDKEGPDAFPQPHKAAVRQQVLMGEL